MSLRIAPAGRLNDLYGDLREEQAFAGHESCRVYHYYHLIEVGGLGLQISVRGVRHAGAGRWSVMWRLPGVAGPVPPVQFPKGISIPGTSLLGYCTPNRSSELVQMSAGTPILTGKRRTHGNHPAQWAKVEKRVTNLLF